MWQVWISLIEWLVVGLVLCGVGAWGLYECFRPERRARVQREVCEILARCQFGEENDVKV